MNLRRIMGLGEIAGRYDLFLLDQYGVLHDGQRLYAPVSGTIAKLAAEGKAVIVMTNSGKRSEANRRRLAGMGLPLEPSQVVSSGEVAYQAIAQGELGPPFIRGRKAFIVGRRGDDYGFDGLDLTLASSPDAADFLLILGSNAPEWGIPAYRNFLRGAAQKNTPALCCNPDLEMLTPTGTQPAPGAIARAYEQMGGNVTYIGKPERRIYDYAIKLAGQPDRSRVLAIGDSIPHDVSGARGAGISVALVLTGLSANLPSTAIQEQAAAAKAAPDWILPSLSW
jgi:HAD superfamily hydrolase (TIGR01459 family)